MRPSSADFSKLALFHAHLSRVGNLDEDSLYRIHILLLQAHSGACCVRHNLSACTSDLFTILLTVSAEAKQSHPTIPVWPNPTCSQQPRAPPSQFFNYSKRVQFLTAFSAVRTPYSYNRAPDREARFFKIVLALYRRPTNRYKKLAACSTCPSPHARCTNLSHLHQHIISFHCRVPRDIS